MKYFYFLVVMLIISSCTDFLDQVPKHNLTLENSVTDYNGAKNIVNGMYSVIEDNSYLGGSIACFLSSQGGFYNSYPMHYKMEYRESNEGTYLPVIWRSLYSIVNSANAAIEGLSNLTDDKYPSPQRKLEMIAEARCMRAWAFTNLFWLYARWWDADESPYGIIFRDKMANLSNLQVSRSTVGESYEIIFDDLENAIEYLPGFTTPRYLSNEMAQVIKAKLLLYRGAMRGSNQDLKDALTLILNVKNNSPADFQMESDITEMYQKGWDSKEVLWTRYLGDKSPITYSEFDYSYGIGYTNVYYSFADGWLKEDLRYDLVMGNARAPETWDDRTVFTPIKLYHGGRYDTPDAPYTAYYFRFAELYLMEAEIKARLDDYSVEDALKPLNEMRSMRTNPILPNHTASSKRELLRLIFKEIWVEQFLENGSEYFASLRFINDTDAGPAQNKPWIYTLKSDVNFTEDHYCWPIPSSELVKNYLAEQNPGLDK